MVLWEVYASDLRGLYTQDLCIVQYARGNVALADVELISKLLLQ